MCRHPHPTKDMRLPRIHACPIVASVARAMTCIHAHWAVVAASTDHVRHGVLQLLYPNRPECDKNGHEQPRVELSNV